jgi:hypothetical protein
MNSSDNVATYSLINNADKKSTSFSAVNSPTTRIVSDSDKADLITKKLEQHAIALQVLSKYPDAMNDYRIAIGAKQ